MSREDHRAGTRQFGGKRRNPDRSDRPQRAKSAGSTNTARMRISARDIALRAVQDVLDNAAYASQALSRQLSACSLKEEERRFAASLFYHTIENWLSIEFMLDHLLETRPERLCWEILCLGAAQILYMDGVPDRAAVDEAVKQTRANRREGMTGMVNGVLRALVRAKDDGTVETWLPNPEENPIAWLSLRYAAAEPVARRLIDAYGMHEAARILAWKPEAYVQTIRPNETRITGADFENYLSSRGVQWSKGMVNGAYNCASSGDLTRLDGFRQGLFSIQSESSMLAALAVDAKPGQYIIDTCAAPGGKTVLMAEHMRGAGRVYAWDIHPHRVELIKAAAQRLGLDNVRPSLYDARKAPESLLQMADAVLIDAPCSGLGVMADKPDIKFRATDQSFEALLPLQRDILNASAELVKPGGVLVYSTCTILPGENAAQVEAFLETHPEFEPCSDVSYLPEPLRARAERGIIQIRQDRDGIEGFFICKMRRKTR